MNTYCVYLVVLASFVTCVNLAALPDTTATSSIDTSTILIDPVSSIDPDTVRLDQVSAPESTTATYEGSSELHLRFREVDSDWLEINCSGIATVPCRDAGSAVVVGWC